MQRQRGKVEHWHGSDVQKCQYAMARESGATVYEHQPPTTVGNPSDLLPVITRTSESPWFLVLILKPIGVRVRHDIQGDQHRTRSPPVVQSTASYFQCSHRSGDGYIG